MSKILENVLILTLTETLRIVFTRGVPALEVQAQGLWLKVDPEDFFKKNHLPDLGRLAYAYMVTAAEDISIVLHELSRDPKMGSWMAQRLRDRRQSIIARERAVRTDGPVVEVRPRTPEPPRGNKKRDGRNQKAAEAKPETPAKTATSAPTTPKARNERRLEKVAPSKDGAPRTKLGDVFGEALKSVQVVEKTPELVQPPAAEKRVPADPSEATAEELTRALGLDPSASEKDAAPPEENETLH